MTNNPFKLKCLKAMGIKVQARIPMLVAPNPHSERYLQAKSRRMSHLLALDEVEVRLAQKHNITSGNGIVGFSGLKFHLELSISCWWRQPALGAMSAGQAADPGASGASDIIMQRD